ncbi:ThuA domain-containing protein [Ochrovirga pacifica]|uniref:ThuA domain-containing protein n=1 Tax=Ochrovirga pacifica TaxID=1042376 RepID=UPI0002559AB4|nr:ThuA domain-containing protein [Ochrovirga pacifica]
MKFLKNLGLLIFYISIVGCSSKHPIQTVQKNIHRNVLVFSKTAGFRHTSIPKGIEMFKELATKNQWQITFSEDANLFTYEELKKYQTVVFLNTTGDILNKQQEKAFEKYMNNGGGFTGIHAATDTEFNWPFYEQMVGAQFKSHPPRLKARLVKNKDCKHPATDHLPDSFYKFDEWYNFRKPVAKHANVLLYLDETSYEGKKMGTEHPIAWYHTYEGGRVFYTGMGHTEQIYDDPDFVTHVEKGIQWTLGNIHEEIPKEGISMLDENLSKWDIWMGVPHTTVKNLEPPKFDNVMKGGIPLGLHNDPKKVYSVMKENDELVLKITGEIYGGLTSKNEFGDYHFSAQFKWGTKKWEPRLKTKRDSGIIYHAKGPHGAFWDTWMSCLEYQVQESDCGDFFPLGRLRGDAPFRKETNTQGKTYKIYDPSQKPAPTAGHVAKSKLYEKPNGQWNTIEVYCLGNESIHLVNGYVVNRVMNARQIIDGKEVAVTRGKIQIQSEAAEVYYKNIQINPITQFPKKYRNQ